jgi:hypothetical protein
MDSKLPPPQWNAPAHSDARAVAWFFVFAFAGACLAEMFLSV